MTHRPSITPGLVSGSLLRAVAALVALVALICAGGAGGALAAGSPGTTASRVLLRNGRVLSAKSWRVEGAFLSIELAGGGRVSLPIDRILRTEQQDAFAANVADGLPALDPGVGGTCDPWVDERVTRWETLAVDAAGRHGLEPALVRAVIAAESCGNPRAVSPKGAQGLMQLMPSTAADYGVSDPFDPSANVDAGCRHLARLRDKLGDGLDLLLAAYNAGEGVVERAGGVPDYRETRAYVSRVKGWLSRADRPGGLDG